jgi:hypothetical protein
MKKSKLFIVFLLFLSIVWLQAQEFSITIDGEKDAWYNGLTEPLNGVVYLPAACYLTGINATGPDDDNDLSALVWLAWDENYLYMYEEVKDDYVTVSAEGKWNNDCFEFKFDPDPSLESNDGVASCRLSALGKEDAIDTLGVDNINDDTGDENTPGLVDEEGTSYEATTDDYFRKRTDDGYVLEMRVPLAYINVPAHDKFLLVEEGNYFGLVLNQGDNDGTARDNMLQWSAGHNDVAWNQATYHGTATFLADNRMELEAENSIDGTINENADEWYIPDLPSGIGHLATEQVPVSATLAQNYPNPFNPATQIRFNLTKAQNVTFTIYDISGRTVAELIKNQAMNIGDHSVVWDGTDSKGQPVSSSIYIYELRAGSSVTSKKMILMR